MPGALLGQQRPRVAHRPAEPAFSHADDAAFLAASYQLVPDEWQHYVLEDWLAQTAEGRWCYGRCGLAVPRQNGKNGCAEVAELYKLVALGRSILHTAHEVKTARKAFLRLASFFETPDTWPELAAMCTAIRKTNGQEAILLTNGGSVEYVARSRGSGRGYTVDDLVLDEAQELTDEQLDALLPTISSAPTGNPQITLLGTPPGPGSPGEVFTRTREAGHAGRDGRLCWHEWSLERMGDVADQDTWAQTNPALGGRLLISVVEDELATMSPDGFARERLGLWPSEAGRATVVPMAAWARQATTTPPTEGLVAYAVDMSPDRSVLAISAARKGPLAVHVECVRHESTSKGYRWAVDWLTERWTQAAAVVVDGQSPAMALLPELQAARVKVTITGASDMARACGMFHDAVLAGELTHYDQPGLTAALEGARKRDIGQAGGWGWNRKRPEVDITPLVAATLAHYGLLTSKRRPGRTARVRIMT